MSCEDPASFILAAHATAVTSLPILHNAGTFTFSHFVGKYLTNYVTYTFVLLRGFIFNRKMANSAQERDLQGQHVPTRRLNVEDIWG